VSGSVEPRTWHHGLVARWWDEFNEARPEELARYGSAIRESGGAALDLACGTGRLLVALLREGLDVDGVDVSADMLDLCRRRAESAGRSPTLLRQAMHELDPPRRYGTIYICDSFGIGGSRDRDREALRRVRAALDDGGQLLVSHDLPYSDAAGWPRWLPGGRADLPEEWPERGRRRTCADGTTIELRQRLEGFDPVEQRVTMGIAARHRAGDELLAAEEMSIDISMYFRAELVDMLHDADFTDVTVEGYYTGVPATADETSVLFVARP
jgi:SAM-dependent methyltransferase